MSDRIFGAAMIVVALAYIASATQIETSFLSDPVGPKTFPIIIGGVAAIGGLLVLVRPVADPNWPGGWTVVNIAIAVVALVAYAYSLRPFGFLIPTALAAGVLSYQIRPRARAAAVTGLGLSVGLFFIFKYALGLGLFAFPKSWAL
ncbi:MAG: tripartite tricarboxylate transporter TctB family protein [Gammaproteobacteria bacterium]